MRVLLVDDDRRLTAVLSRALVEAGHEVDTCADGRSALQVASTGVFDAVVLDWMMPHLDGPTVCRTLREREIYTPVLLLTARTAVADRVAGLDALADDILAKPFSLDELLARLRALRRRGLAVERPVHVVGDLTVDTERRTVSRGATPVLLTAREFDLLALLAGRSGRVLTRQQILDDVWDGETDLRSNVIDVHVAALRAKLDKPFGLQSIQTLRGVGYRLLSP